MSVRFHTPRGEFQITKGQERKVPRFLNRMLGLPIDVQVRRHAPGTTLLASPRSAAPPVLQLHRFCDSIDTW